MPFSVSEYDIKELIPEKETGKNNPMYQLLIFNPHITSPPPIHTDQYSNTLPTS